MPQYSASLVSVGVDTLTCSAGGDEKLPYLRSLGMYLFAQSCKRGNRGGYFKRGPYVGGQTREVGYAEHGERGLVELRGGLARDWGQLILPWSDKVSRIDVQVTVRQDPYDDRLAWDAWESARERAKAEGKPPRYTLWADATKGSTLYVGRLGSRFMGRLYEKGKESPRDGWGNAWRYEVQARRERAEQVALELGRSAQPDRWIAGTVAEHFARRGVEPIYSPEDPVRLSPLPKEESDTAKALRWLAQGVAPVLSRLEGSGDYEAALKALGIGRTLEHP